jgi:beta-N-acetylhexosaminidase
VRRLPSPHLGRGRGPLLAGAAVIAAAVLIASIVHVQGRPDGASAPAAASSALPPPPDPTAPLSPSALPPPGSTASAGADVPPTTPQTPPGDAASRCAVSTLARMSVTDRAGQVLMVGVTASVPSSTATLVRRYQVGGVFLRGRSSAGVAALAGRTAAVQRAAATSGARVRVHVAADQEGGLVQTLSGPGFGPVPSAVEQGTWAPDVLRGRARAWASALRRAGVTMNLAPVADTVAPVDLAANPPIGAVRRNYGETPVQVAPDVVQVVRGFGDAGLVATLKHFPGLGRVQANTDVSTQAVDAAASASDPNLDPFRAGTAAGAEAIMISSARYPRLDPDRIAAFSPEIVTGLLRGDLGFTGLVVSDDLGSAVAVRSVPVGSRAVRFVAAGGDLVLTNRSADAGPMRSALVAQAGRSAAFQARLASAATRVLESKARHGLLTCS